MRLRVGAGAIDPVRKAAVRKALRRLNMRLFFFAVISIFFASAAVASAQQPATPAQTGGQEPEMPGEATPSWPSGSEKVSPEPESGSKTKEQKTKQRKERAEKRKKCAPGQNADACRNLRIQHN